ncbi:response regulator transcription factor [Pseudomonas pergaminensis]
MRTLMSKTHSIMLLDDHEMVRQGIELGLSNEADLEVVGSFGTGRELLEALAAQPVEVIIMDFTLGPTELDGLSLIRAVSRRFKQSRPVVLSSHCTPATVSMALKAGCWGVVGKTQKLAELIMAVRTVAQGYIYLQPGMLSVEQGRQSILEWVNFKSNLEVSAALRPNACLTPKEQEVLRCFLDGMLVSSIAIKFSRSTSTISTQKQSAYRKLGIRTDSELFKFTRQFGKPE